MASGADGVSAHDISHEASSTWGARTASGIVLVAVRAAMEAALSGVDLVILTNGESTTITARPIGPVSGHAPEGDRWRIAERYRVDVGGEPLSSIISATLPAGSDIERHDWGALGLPHGLETRVRQADEATGISELTLARASSGYRQCDETPLLSLAPGDRVRLDGREGTVLAVDRRKRTVEIDAGDEPRVAAFEDVQIQETT